MKSSELIHRYFLGIATEEEVSDLDTKLRDDEALQDEFLLQAELDTHLRQEAQSDLVNRESTSIERELRPFAVECLNRNRIAWRAKIFQLSSIGAAAAILCVFLILQVGGQSAAMAAVQRSLEMASELKARQYLLHLEIRRPTGETRTIAHELFTRGGDDFVLRYSARTGSTVSLGRHGEDCWVVPPIGPVRKGDPSVHRRWLLNANHLAPESGPQKVAALSEMNVTALLTQMSRGYQLEITGEEELVIDDQRVFPCHRVRARRKADTPSHYPDVIDLWTSIESGVAMRLRARWDLADGEPGRKSFEFTLRNEEPSLSLPDDWFTAEAHYEGFRPTIRMDSANK